MYKEFVKPLTSDLESSTSHIIKVLTANFDIPIYPRQLKNFRGSVIEAVLKLKNRFSEAGIDTELFHNRWEEKDFEQKHYRYPLVQYHINGRKASITGISEGAEALQLLLEYRPAKLKFDNTEHEFNLFNKESQEIDNILLDEAVAYRIYKWLPLNPENFKIWNSNKRLSDKIVLLEKCLFGHIKSYLQVYSKEIPDKKIEVYLRNIGKESLVMLHKHKRLAFDLSFYSNINLPQFIGLGQSPAHGFGKIRKFDMKFMV